MQSVTINSKSTITYNETPNEMSKKQKAAVLAGSALGVGAVFAVIAKRNGYSLNPKRILNTPLKDLAIFKSVESATSVNKPLEMGDAWNIMAMATGAIAGGFISGAIVDKENITAKKKEALTQLLGNVITPVTCVSLIAKFYKKHQTKLEEFMPQIHSKKMSEKTLDKVNKFLKGIPNIVATLGALTAGIFTGNKVCNFINEKLYHKKCNRDVRVSDFAPHIDDLCIAISVTNPESPFVSRLSRTVPPALVVPGYNAGSARD